MKDKDSGPPDKETWISKGELLLSLGTSKSSWISSERFERETREETWRKHIFPPGRWLCEFPAAAVTNSHKLSGLKTVHISGGQKS